MNDKINLRKEPKNYDICFMADNETKVTIHADTGRVELAEGVDIDEASELFWTVLAGESPKALLTEIEDLKMRLQAYETEGSRVAEFDLAMVSVVENPEEGCEFSPEMKEDIEHFQSKMSAALDRDDYDRAMKVIE